MVCETILLEGRKRKRKKSTDTGVILGILLDISMMTVNILEQRKWTLVMPGAASRGLAACENFSLACLAFQSPLLLSQKLIGEGAEDSNLFAQMNVAWIIRWK